MCRGRGATPDKDFLSTLLVSTFLMRCIRNVPSVMELTIITLMLKKSVCIVWGSPTLHQSIQALTVVFEIYTLAQASSGHEYHDAPCCRVIEDALHNFLNEIRWTPF